MGQTQSAAIASALVSYRPRITTLQVLYGQRLCPELMMGLKTRLPDYLNGGEGLSTTA
jgi:hypothetical protein